MGMLDKWFGGRKDMPSLPADNAAVAKIDEVKPQLEELANRVHDHLEIVPGEHEAYVYVGKPPKRFGIAWVHDGKVDGLNELVEQHKLSQSQVQQLVGALGAPRPVTALLARSRRVTVLFVTAPPTIHSE